MDRLIGLNTENYERFECVVMGSNSRLKYMLAENHAVDARVKHPLYLIAEHWRSEVSIPDRTKCFRRNIAACARVNPNIFPFLGDLTPIKPEPQHKDMNPYQTRPVLLTVFWLSGATGSRYSVLSQMNILNRS